MRILILLFGFVAAAYGAAPGDSSIVDPYIEAHRKRNVDALMALVEISPDTPAAIVERLRTSFQQSLDLKITEARVLPLDAEDQKSISALLKVSDPTLQPVAKFVVTWDVATQPGPAKETASTKFIGVKDGRYRFVTAKNKMPNQAAVPTPASVTPAADAPVAPAAAAAHL